MESLAIFIANTMPTVMDLQLIDFWQYLVICLWGKSDKTEKSANF